MALNRKTTAVRERVYLSATGVPVPPFEGFDEIQSTAPALHRVMMVRARELDVISITAEEKRVRRAILSHLIILF